MVSPSLAEFLHKTAVKSYSGVLYHGSPKGGLRAMLTDGIHGTGHGELSEYETFSTSPNDAVLGLFGSGNGVEFEVSNIRVLVIDDFLADLCTRESSMEFENDADALEAFCERFQIEKNRRGEYALPHGYLSSLEVDAVCYAYAWKMIEKQRHNAGRDECEICFLGDGIAKLDGLLSGAIVDDDPFWSYDNPEWKEKALAAIGDEAFDESEAVVDRACVLIEAYTDDEDAAEDEKTRRAEEYFSIGHHNARNDWKDSEHGYDEPEADWCWIWDGGLRVAQGGSHSISFGHNRVGRFKGWFDVESGTLSFADEQGRVTTEDEIPAQLYAHLKRRFKPKTIRIF